MDVAQLVALAIGVFGVAGVIFTALRFNRDDTTAIVTQQSMLVGEMTAVNTELRTTAETLRSERDRCHEEVARLRQLTQRHDG